MTIQPKKKPTIKKGEGAVYHADTFAPEPNFFDVSAEELLERVRPFEFMGRRFITFDTETHPYFRSSQECTAGHVRRWVGTGKSATPQDYPFSMQICDGTNSFTVYDSVETGFAEFKKLAPLFEDASIEKIAHNTKFDMHMFANIDMRIVGKLHDTVVLAKLTDENRPSYTLKDLAAKTPGGIVKYEYMVDNYKQANRVNDYRRIPRPLLSQYGMADVWNCYRVFVTEYPKLIEDELEALYNNEMELMVALYAMERYGMRLDAAYEAPLKQELQELCDKAEGAVYDEAGYMFNMNSNKQLYKVLMEQGVDPTLIAMTDKGNPCLDKNALNNLAELHNVSIVQKILEYRKYSKLLVTYAVGIYDQRDAHGKVHSSINQTEATTGRMSITKPALQTLPKKDKHIRTAFIPDDDCTLVFMDLDQVEYRLFAHYAKLPDLLQKIAEGYDVHAATAALLYNQDLDDFVARVHAGDKDATNMRSSAKTINFALLYGVGQGHLSELLKCSETEAASIKANYFSQMPEAKVFIQTVYNVIKMRGYVRNFYGRRRRLSSDDCYKAPNSLIQGCAADYIKFKLVRMYKYIKYHDLSTHMINIVHDEVVLNFSNSEMEHVPVLRWLMSEFDQFRCPITAGLEYGTPDWGHKVEPEGVDFQAPKSMDFLNYNVFDGSVFGIYK